MGSIHAELTGVTGSFVFQLGSQSIVTGFDIFDSASNTVLSIFPDSGNTNITLSTGDLVFDNPGTTDDIVFRLGTDTNATRYEVRNDSDVALFSVRGNGNVFVHSTFLDLGFDSSSKQLQIGAGAEFGLFFDGNDAHIEFDGTGSADLIIENTDTQGEIINRLGDTSGDTSFLIQNSNGTAFFSAFSDGLIIATNINGVLLSSGGVATNFLNETGNYSVPPETSPGGALNDIQYNNPAGTFKGENVFTYDDTNGVLLVTGKVSHRNTLDLKITDNADEGGISFKNTANFHTAAIYRTQVLATTRAHLVIAMGLQSDPTLLTDAMRFRGDAGFDGDTDVLGQMRFPADSASFQLAFGLSDDLQLYHDGDDSYFVNTFGDLIIDNQGATSSTIHRLGTTDNTTTFEIRDSSNSILFDVRGSGEVFINQQLLSFGFDSSTDQIQMGGGGEFGFFFDGNDSNILVDGTGGNLIIDNTDTQGFIINRLGTDTDATGFQIRDNSDAVLFQVLGTGDVAINGTGFSYIESTGNVAIGNTAGLSRFLVQDTGTTNIDIQSGAAGRPQLRLFNSGGYSWNFGVGGTGGGFQDNWVVRDVTLGLDRLLIDTLGRTGFKNTSPKQVVDAEGSIECSDTFVFSNDSTQDVASTPEFISGRLSTTVLNQTFDISTQDIAPNGIFFRPDGLKMYMAGNDNNAIFEYDLTTAWDISTLVINDSLSISSQTISPSGIWFKQDGLIMLMSGNESGNEQIFQYDLSTAWDITTAVFDDSFDVEANSANPFNVTFKPDGYTFYVGNTVNDDVVRYDLTTPWVVTTASFTEVFAPTEVSEVQGVGFRLDGMVMYVTDTDSNYFFEYLLSTPWDITTAEFQSELSVILAGATNIRGPMMSTQNHKLYFCDQDTQLIYEFDVGLKTEGEIRNNIGKAAINPPNIIEINTQEEFDALASGGVITFAENTAIELKTSVTTTDRFVGVAGHVVFINAQPISGVTLNYSGTGDFFGGTGQIEIGNIIVTSSSTGTLFNYTIEDDSSVIIVENSLFAGWDDLGEIIGGNTIFALVGIVNISSGLTFTNAVSVGLTNIRYLPGSSTISTSLFTVETNRADSSYDFSGMFINSLSSTGSIFDFPTTNNMDARFAISNVSFADGHMFKPSFLSDAIITAVADDSPSTATITAMADNGSDGTTISTTTTFYDNEEVTITGTTSYNGTFQIFNVVAGVSFDILVVFVADDATGSVDSVRLDITLSGGHGITAGNDLKIINTNFYNGFVPALNVATNVLTINGTFISTNTGDIERELSLDQTDPRVRAFNNPQVADSHYIAGAFVNNNTTATGTIINNTNTDMVFGTVGSALEASSTMERWKLIDELNGTFEYTGNEPFDGYITFDYTVEATAEEEFRFKWVIDTGSGFSDLIDAVEALASLKDTATSITKTFPLKAVKGNQIKPELTRNAGTAGITTQYATIYVSQ